MSKVLLKDIAEIQSGPFGTQLHKDEYVTNGILMLNAKNIGNGLVLTESVDYVSDDVCSRLAQYVLKEGDILFGRAGSIERHTYIDERYMGCFQGTNCIRIRCNNPDISRFVSYYLWLPIVKQRIENQTGGSILSYITSDLLKEIEIDLPDESTIEKVTNALLLIDKKILNNNRINDNLLNQLKTIYDYWFVQFDFPDENGNPYRSSGGKMVWNDKLKRDIPTKWICQNIRNLTSITWGQCPDGKNILSKSANKKNLIDYCSGAGDMKGGFLVDCQSKTDNSKRFAYENDILVSVAGKIGDMCVVDHPISLGRAAMAFSANNYYELTYIYLTLQTLNKKMTTISTGSIQKVINNDHIDEFNFPYNEDIVAKFGELTQNIFDEFKQISNENKELKKLRDWLLPMLMNGQATIED